MRKVKFIFIVSILSLLIISSLTTSFAAYTSPYAEPSYLVKYGSRGTGVKWVQDLLKQNGYTITIDGIFGMQTKNAVIHFQKYNNLDTDGIVGPLTRKALKKSVSYITNTQSASSSITTSSINSYMYTTSNVNFRSGPKITYSSYGVIPKGTKIYVLQQRSDNWSYIKYNNRYGYVSSTYISNTSPITNVSTGLPTFNRRSTNLLNIIKNCKTYYSSNNFKYSLAIGARTIPADASNKYNSYYRTDCSTYVSWVLYEYALANGKTSMKNYFSTQKNSSVFASIGANGGNSYLQTVNGLSNARAGDILVTPGHVEFLSSYNTNSNGSLSIKVYNCGSNSSIAAPGITTSATKYESEILYILRVK